MKRRIIIRYSALLISLILIITACGCVNKDTSSSTKEVKQLNLYENNLFNYSIVRPSNASSELLGYIKESIFKKARAINDKRPDYVTDDNIPEGEFNGIFIGETSAEISKEAKKKFDVQKPLANDFQIMVKDGDISIYAGNDEAIKTALKYFCDNILKDSKSTISSDLYYYSSIEETGKLYIDGVDITRFIIRCAKFPDGMVYRGCEELQKAINDFSGYMVPIVCGDSVAGYDNYKNIIDVKVSGENYNDYSIKLNNGNVDIIGGQDYSLNAALHAFAVNLENLEENKTVNIKSDFEISGRYDENTVGTDGYRLVFADEFDGNVLNTSVWDFDEYVAHDVTYNNKNSVVVEDGLLKCISKETTLPNGEKGWSGTKMRARNGVWFTYGYFEARIKLPSVLGNFTAFWAVGQRTETKPYTLEIDVFESYGTPLRLGSQFHSWWNNNEFIGNIVANESQRSQGHIMHLHDVSYMDLRLDRNKFPYVLPEGKTFADDYHTFGCEWTPTYISIYFDGQLMHTEDTTSLLKDPVKGFPVAEYAFFTDGQPMTLAIDAGLTIFDDMVENADKSITTPSVMEVDWVHLYQMDGVGKISDKYYEK